MVLAIVCTYVTQNANTGIGRNVVFDLANGYIHTLAGTGHDHSYMGSIDVLSYRPRDTYRSLLTIMYSLTTKVLGSPNQDSQN